MKRSEMKNLLLILSFFLVFSCDKKKEGKVNNNDVVKKENSEIFYPRDLIELELKDSLNWAAQFKELQKSFLENDETKIKTFVKIPIMSKYNGIWHMLEIDITEDNNVEVPFTDKDFEKYHHLIFSPVFLELFQKIDFNEFYVKGNYETKFIKKGKERYKMICSKVDDLYILNLYSEAEYEERMGNMEFSVIYEFKIINEKLKLIDIQLAG
jgi:hypothetical protein